MGWSNYTQLPAAQAPSGTSETVIIANYDNVCPGGNAPQGRVIRGVLVIANADAGAAVTGTIKCRGVPFQAAASPPPGNVPLAQGTTSGVSSYSQVGGSAQLANIPESTTLPIPFSFMDTSEDGYAYYMITLTAGTTTELNVTDGALEIMEPEPYGADV